jgi:hypothetical protein
MCCSVLVACIAAVASFVPVVSLSACVGVDGAAVAVTASTRPATVRMEAGTDCAVLAAGGELP